MSLYRPSAVETQRKDHTRLRNSLICGLGLSMVCVLRPIVTFVLHNEGEFFFWIHEVMLGILLLFAGVAAAIALLHALLPKEGKVSLRLIFAALAAATAICVYIQNNFMSAYLPILTGDAIPWENYTSWNLPSILLWGGVFAAAIAAAIIKPAVAKKAFYGILTALFFAELLSCGMEWITAKHENAPNRLYFSNEGMYQTSKQGNVVVLVSDTFEGTYMNEILERYPEYRDMLSDCTYYDNVTGASCFTYFSYANLMTGKDFPLGATSKSGIRNCFEQQTLVDTIGNNGWEMGYYTVFNPTEDMSDKILNYMEKKVTLKPLAQLKISWCLWRSTLFQSAPHPLKKYCIVDPQEFEDMKDLQEVEEGQKRYKVSDTKFFKKIAKRKALKAVDGAPRYSLFELNGVHAPCKIDADFNTVEYDDSVTPVERKIQGARGQLKLLRNYLDQLKAAGTYDQTTVIMTADHGYNMRFYPVFIVKEAGKGNEAFRIDHTPLSIREDYETLMDRLTKGQTFSEAVEGMSISPERVRYAVDFNSTLGYKMLTDRRSLVKITGDAREEDSYSIAQDEYLTDESFAGRYKVGEPFIKDRQSDGTVAVYGMVNDVTNGHTMLLDFFFDEDQKGALELRMKVRNTTGQDQRAVFYVDDAQLCEETIGVGQARDLIVSIPEHQANRMTIRIELPDAVRLDQSTETLGWNWYYSIGIDEAGLYPVE